MKFLFLATRADGFLITCACIGNPVRILVLRFENIVYLHADAAAAIMFVCPRTVFKYDVPRTVVVAASYYRGTDLLGRGTG